MWENLSWTGNNDWIVDLIREGTCVAVADGLYMDDLYLEISLAMMVLECVDLVSGERGLFVERPDFGVLQLVPPPLYT